MVDTIAIGLMCLVPAAIGLTVYWLTRKPRH
jgi:hypothetical protein